MNDPIGVAIDRDRNVLIADALYHRIRRVTPDGTITTIAGNGFPDFAGDGGPATAASLQYPTGVTLDHDGNIFIADAANHRIRRIDHDGTITTVAGTFAAGFDGDGGPATEALLNFPTEVLLDGKQHLLIADSSNGRVRSVDRDGIITTIAGGGSDTPADGLPATSVSWRAAPPAWRSMAPGTSSCARNAATGCGG
jgi:hypothetical protein